MQRLLAVVLFALALLVAAPAEADPYASNDYAFTSDFPNPPAVGTPAPSEKDAAGNVLSMSVMINGSQQGVYFAGVGVDTFTTPTVVDVAASLTMERDNYVKAFGASLLESHVATLDGQQAVFFTYEKTDHGAKGRGIIIVVPSKLPRVYVVAVAYAADAPQDELDMLNRFVDSFHLTL